MAVLQEHYLSEGSLSIGGILKGIEALLQCDDLDARRLFRADSGSLV